MSPNGDLVVKVFEAWQSTVPRPGATRLTDDRRRVIAKALKHYPVEELVTAVTNWPKSAHHRGENDRQTIYNDIALILRDAKHIEFFRDIEDNRQPAFG